MKQSNYLLLIWKDPKTRRNFVIGKLCRTVGFTFEYCCEFTQAEDYGWSKLDAFPEEKIYESTTLFPVFASRLPDKKRRDIEKILQKYGLSKFDDFELLRKSEARLPIDTYSFIDPIFAEDETVQREFFIMGIRHHAPCEGKNCTLLPRVKIDDELVLKREPKNLYDSRAICVLTKDEVMLGYVPRYYNSAILERMDKGMTYSCKVVDINLNQDCSECIKVRLEMPHRR
ncbi:MAG: HipA N-terminal domain-containing protein [Lachnospiraceae bacterium]|nr:HipA N-terminal domain-containing protein [Lachnospiraceae bacterium]